MKAGDVFENPVTGEYGYVRVGPDESEGELLVADLRVKVGGAVIGEHFHPIIRERFTIIQGTVGYMMNGKKGIAVAGDMLDIQPGVPHDWWNAGNEEARIIVQVKPGKRFEKMILTLYGLAKEGKTNSKGEPSLLQLAVTATEFRDVIQLTIPPKWVQSLLFGILAPIGRLAGYKASYPRFDKAPRTVEVEPLPEGIVINDI
jgi:quercetin dioxygenase-like cupin family protein